MEWNVGLSDLKEVSSFLPYSNVIGPYSFSEEIQIADAHARNDGNTLPHCSFLWHSKKLCTLLMRDNVLNMVCNVNEFIMYCHVIKINDFNVYYPDSPGILATL